MRLFKLVLIGAILAPQTALSEPVCQPWAYEAVTGRTAARADPYTATLAAGRYIQHLLEDFDGDERSVVMAYNMGGTNLRKHGPTKAARALAELVTCAFRIDPLFLRSMD